MIALMRRTYVLCGKPIMSQLISVSDRSHGGVTADFENLSDVITLTPADIILAFKSLKL